MPQVPVYNRQQGIPAQANAVPGNVASAGAVGAGLQQAGEAGAQLGSALQAANDRLNARKDAISRARDLANVNKAMDEASTKWQTEDDATDPAAVERFGATAAELIQKAISEHTGSEESRDKLAARLEALRMQYGAQASSFAIKQQQELVTKTLGSRIRELSARVASNPGELMEAFKSLDADIDDMSAALTPAQEEEQRTTGRSLILKSTIQTFIDKGDVAGAKRILDETPGVAKILKPGETIKLRSAITKYEVEQEKSRNAGNLAVRKAAQILGREPTSEERAKLAGVDMSATGVSGKIVALEKALGRPLEPEEIKRIGGIDGGTDFGKGLTGRALAIITDDAPSFASGLLDADSERRFLAAVNQYTQPVTQPNPDTGVLETRSPTLPQFVVEALRRRGFAVPNQKPPSPMDAPQAGEPVGTTALTGGKTIFGLAGKITGPIPSAAEAIGRVPVIGEFINSPEMTQARQAVSVTRRDLIRTLQNNPKFADAERKAIEEETNIDFSIIDTPSAFRNRMIGIDDALAVRESNALKTAQNKTVPVEERKQALAVFNALQNFRLTLGVPVRVKTVEEAKKLAPGTEFIDPNGVIRRVPSE